jgi:hypothetical protein
MKKLLLPVFLCACTLAFAQSKQESFIKKYLYIKASPTLLAMGEATDNLPIESGLAPAIFGAVGAKTRYAALGFSAGYFNLKNAGPITPLGVDLTITDFKRKKAFPVITAQWHKAHFKEQYTIGRQGSNNFQISGSNMRSIGAGVAFRAFKTTKMLVTLGFSRLNSKTTLRTHSPYTSTGATTYWTTHFKDHQDMLVLSAGFVL